MKIILLKDIKNVGKNKEIVEVNDGYAKNFLLKQKMAVMYSNKANDILNNQIELEEKDKDILKSKANILKDKLESQTHTFNLKVHNGNAFGSISAKEILEEINKEEKMVTKYMLIDFHPFSFGKHFLKVKLYDNIFANIKINVEVIDA